MNCLALRPDELIVASLDAVLHYSHVAVQSDFGLLIPNSIKYIIGFKQHGAGGG
jgi:hypothetical protein